MDVWPIEEDEIRALRVIHFGVYVMGGHKQWLWGHIYEDFYKGFDAYMSSVLACLAVIVDGDEFTDIVMNLTNTQVVTRYLRLSNERDRDKRSYVWTDYYVIDAKGEIDRSYVRRFDYKDETHPHPHEYTRDVVAGASPVHVSYLTRRYSWNQSKIERLLKDLNVT